MNHGNNIQLNEAEGIYIMTKGKLIVIEGTDSSGKATQTELLYRRLASEYNVMKLDFPNYKSESSIFVKNYLNGEYGANANEVDPYVASTFYTLDRYDTFKRDIEDFYRSGGILVADRYTTANMVHQAAKIEDKVLRDKYLDWLTDWEFNKFGLPVPDIVFLLDLPTEYSQKLNEKRANKIDGSGTKDIHESDIDHLRHAYKSAHYVADKYGWSKINCINGDSIRTIEDISQEIYNKAIGVIR